MRKILSSEKNMFCPRCNWVVFHERVVRVYAGHVWVEFTCNKCGAKWRKVDNVGSAD